MECKRIIAGLFIYAGFASSVFSQTTGKVVDTNLHPVEGATIVMQLPDSTYLGATISAADGHSCLSRNRRIISSSSSIYFIRLGR